MTIPLRSKPLLALASLALVLAACEGTLGDLAASEGSTTTTAPSTTTMAIDDEGKSDHDHSHGTVEWVGAAVPEVALEVVEDPKSGWNVFADVTGFVFAPKHASGEHVDGEGHAHIDLDGERLARVYGTAWHISELDPGAHEISFTLAANDHNVYTVDGEALTASATVDVPVPSGETGHDHGAESREWDGPASPSVDVSIFKDAKSGWNLIADVSGLDIAPRAASTEHVPGQGHLHWFLNGVKQGRLYNTALHIPELPPGDLEISVGFSGNDHVDYVLDGAPLEASARLTVSEDEGTGSLSDDGDAVAGPSDVVEIVVEDGAVVGGVETIHVELGSMVRFVVTSDTSDHVHVHGYDLFFDVTPGEETEIMFTADVPGIFEVELEDSHLPLVELEVS